MAKKKFIIRAAIKQLLTEKEIYCKQYNLCSSCPCLLSGGYCELKLAIRQLVSSLEQKK